MKSIILGTAGHIDHGKTSRIKNPYTKRHYATPVFFERTERGLNFKVMSASKSMRCA
jgi:selenocysteine-specific translation elongation factor